eukprot:g4971.t1
MEGWGHMTGDISPAQGLSEWFDADGMVRFSMLARDQKEDQMPDVAPPQRPKTRELRYENSLRLTSSDKPIHATNRHDRADNMATLSEMSQCQSQSTSASSTHDIVSKPVEPRRKSALVENGHPMAKLRAGARYQAQAQENEGSDSKVFTKEQEAQVRRRLQVLERLFTDRELELIRTEYKGCMEEFEGHELDDGVGLPVNMIRLEKQEPFLRPEAVEQAYLNLGGDEKGLGAVHVVISELEDVQQSYASMHTSDVGSAPPHPYEMFLNFCLRIKSTVGARGAFLNELKRKNEDARARREAQIRERKERMQKKAIEIKKNMQRKNLKIKRLQQDKRERLQKAGRKQEEFHAKKRNALTEEEEKRAKCLEHAINEKQNKTREKLKQLKTQLSLKQEVRKARSAQIAAAVHKRRIDAVESTTLKRRQKAKEREQHRNARFKLVSIVKQFTNREANLIKSTFARFAEPSETEKMKTTSMPHDSALRLPLIQLALALFELGWSVDSSIIAEEDVYDIVLAVTDRDQAEVEEKGLDLVGFFSVCDALKKGTAGDSIRALSPRTQGGIDAGPHEDDANIPLKRATAKTFDGGAFLRPYVSKVKAAQQRRRHKEKEFKNAVMKKREKITARLESHRQNKNRIDMRRCNMIRSQRKMGSFINAMRSGIEDNSEWGVSKSFPEFSSKYLPNNEFQLNKNIIPVRPATSTGNRRLPSGKSRDAFNPK